MKLLQQCLLIGAVAAGLSSCSQEAPWGAGTGEGQIKLNLAALSDVTAAVPAVRAVTTEVVPPNVEDFQVRVSKMDGSYSKQYASVTDFSKEANFPVGTYEIEAFYGDSDSQGTVSETDKGYEHAYYYGKVSDITVLEGQTTSVQLQSALANAVVVIDYTPEFQKYFSKGFETIIQMDGYDPINLGGSGALNYVQPGAMNITIKGTQQNGKQLVISPLVDGKKFEVEAAHMYKLRYNIYNGELADAKFVIEFDDNLQTEPIEVDLSDELGSVAAPVVTTDGFEPGGNFTTLSGTPFDGEVKFNVVARGDIAEANLTINSDSYKPSFLKSGTINLCAASAADQSAMAAAGIKAVGFYRNPGQMAQLDLTELCRTLPVGTHNISFQVKDKRSQSHEPVTFTLASIPVDMSAHGQAALYGEGYADVVVSYNGPDPTAPGSNPFSFKVQGDNGWLDAEIMSFGLANGTRAYESYDYTYRIAIPGVDRDELPVRIYFNNGATASMETNVAFTYPAYQVETDAMATQLRFRMKTDGMDDVKKRLYFNKLHVYVDGSKVGNNSLKKDAATGIITVTGLSAGSEHTLQTTMQSEGTVTTYGTETTVRMEDALGVPNGDFAQTEETINQTIQNGGQYRVSPTNYTLKCPMKYSEPVGGWASINKKTFYADANPMNTWFTVASTYMSDNNVVIRSVAYDHNGTVPERSGGAFNTKYYCENAPSNIANRAAGELFLGSYAFDGSEHRSEGYGFASRPSSFTFKYQYSPYESDDALVEIRIFDSNGNEIVSKSEKLSSRDALSDYTIAIPSYPFGVKAAKLQIKFLSSTQNPIKTKVPTGSELNENQSLGNKTLSTNATHALSIGSVLTVADLRFTY